MEDVVLLLDLGYVEVLILKFVFVVLVEVIVGGWLGVMYGMNIGFLGG